MIMSERKDTSSEIVVYPENIEEWKTAVAALREKPGLETVTLNLIRAVRAGCEEHEDLHEHIPQLYWEQSLVGQHMVMTQRDLPEGERSSAITQRGMVIMSSGVELAHEYIEEHDMTHLFGASYRFLGRVATYEDEHNKAKSFYEQSRDIYLKEEDPIARSRYLELQAFLTHAMIMTDEAEEGYLLATQTHQAFMESEEGNKLKEHDYATWAIWASGVPIHVAHALIEIDEVGDKRDGLLSWLGDVESILILPEGVETWSDENFTFRRNEIARIKDVLGSEAN